MAQIVKFMSAVAIISSMSLGLYIPTSEAARSGIVHASLHQTFEVVITTGENQEGSVTGATLGVQSEVAGTVLTLDTIGATIAAGESTTFTVTSLGLSGDICFVQLQFTGGSASEWFAESIIVTLLDTQNTVTLKVNSSVKKLTDSLEVDMCKQRQES